MPAFGSHVPQARLSGVWKNWSKFFARHNGSWKRPVSVHVRSGGSWVKVYDERPVVTSSVTRNPQFINGEYYNSILFSVQSNGFESTVSSSNANGGLYPSTIAIDTEAQVSAVKISPFFGDYPTVTITNSSGSVTVS